MAKLPQLTAEQLEQKEKEFQEILANPEKAEKTWQELHDYFITATYSDVQNYWETYWRWYTYLTYKRLNILSKDDVINTAVAQQVPMAMFLGFDVWESLMWYLGLRTLDDDDLSLTYTKMRDAFMNSKALLGTKNGQEITIRDTVQQIKLLAQKGDESLETAEFYSDLRNIIDSKEQSIRKYFEIDLGDVVKDFASLTSFFLAIEPKTIPAVVDGFLHPELAEMVDKLSKEGESVEKSGGSLENLAPKIEPVSETQTNQEAAPAEAQKDILEFEDEELLAESENETEKEDVSQEQESAPAMNLQPTQFENISVEDKTQEIITEQKTEPATEEVVEKVEDKNDEGTEMEKPVEVVKQEFSKVEPVKESAEIKTEPEVKTEPASEVVEQENFTEKTPETSSKPNYTEIKQMVTSRFADKNGKIENIEGTLAFLNGMAEQYNDEKIAELYYFDDEKGDFVWTE